MNQLFTRIALRAWLKGVGSRSLLAWTRISVALAISSHPSTPLEPDSLL